ncbi:hypothetical protein [Prevotella sp. tf2-5]|uniref:hypothetical protein n=1 Tax=Prevotella sp. tf2-5 TaxID=1761889 RepID=UPI0008EA6102|nr:hypothetical protein [Prevotella sp. tf2-5]SFP14655.1 hypothetical protein SAMN04487852_11912 [Prevotella sp. tf2-5]
MHIKSFITHKRGGNVSSIQDSIAMDVEKGRFALSDGVSDSVLPEIWADILTHAYISVEDIQQFPPEGLEQIFLSQKESYVSTLDKEQRYIQKLIEKHFQTGAATFIGIELRENILSWLVIGDSCLFIMPDGEPLQCISSNPSHFDEDGHLNLEFNNYPCQIHSDGSLHGEWTKGERSFDTGSILMMSDAMSAWFVSQLNQGLSPLDQLNAITDNDDFESFVEEQYKQQALESDDESVIMITIDDKLPEHEDVITDTTKTETADKEDENVSMKDFCKKESIDDIIDNADETILTENLNEEETEITEEAMVLNTTFKAHFSLENWKKKFSLLVKSIWFRQNNS